MDLVDGIRQKVRLPPDAGTKRVYWRLSVSSLCPLHGRHTCVADCVGRFLLAQNINFKVVCFMCNYVSGLVGTAVEYQGINEFKTVYYGGVGWIWFHESADAFVLENIQPVLLNRQTSIASSK